MRKTHFLLHSLSTFRGWILFFMPLFLIFCGERTFDNPFDPQASAKEFTVISVLNVTFTLPRDLTWDGSTLWLIDEGTETLYSLNKFSGSVIRTLKSPLSQASGLVYDGSGLWIASYNSTNLFKINVISGETLKKINLQKGRITSLAFDGEKLWGYDKLSNKIYRIDEESGEILSSINNPGFSMGGMEFFDNSLWLSDPNNFSIYKLSAAGVLQATYSAPGQSPLGIAYDEYYVWNVDLNKKIYQLSY
ncbi:MAG: hypothetical protein ACETWK_11885 [Candidatus Aminicenantaceae bacterium]